MKRVLTENPEFGTKTIFHSDADGVHIQKVQDVTNIVEASKGAFNSVDERARWGEWTRVASIPLSILYDLKAKGIADDTKAMKKWLNDRDQRHFRTRPGVV
jgi:hypothetical protein